MKRSAGILPYRVINNKVQVYLEHPGGPFWQGIDKWSICKGEYKYEKAKDAAIREFKEETGFKIDKDELIFIGSHKVLASNKLITIFAIKKDLDPSKMKSNTFIKEWPKGSGIIKEFPEMDKGEWFDIDEAKDKIFDSQVEILRKFVDKYNNGYLS